MEKVNTLSKPNKVIFNGVTYHLLGCGRYYLSYHTRNVDRKKAKGLHVAIWEYYNNREVPKDYCIHHIDGNTFNNDISNLECISRKEHLHNHAIANMQSLEYIKKNREALNQARDKAREWHKSELGHKWHSENAKKRVMKKKELLCQNCGKIFLSVYSDAKFCCDKCGNEYRRKVQLDYVGVCLECGKVFHYGKENSAKPDRMFCSRSCGTRYCNKHRKRRGVSRRN